MARKFMLEPREPFCCRFIKDESRETTMDVTKDKSEGAEKRVEREDRRRGENDRIRCARETTWNAI